MKFCRIGPLGNEIPAVLDKSGTPRSLAGIVEDIDGRSLPMLAGEIATRGIETLPVLQQGRMGSCIGRPGKIVCIGLNYADHAEESGLAVPEEPVTFLKACQPTGPDDVVVLPPEAAKADWEVELAVVIRRRAYRIVEAEANDIIAGYCVMNDLSERAYQHERGGQWNKGKSLPGFAPLGPWLVTPDEIPDPGKLAIWLEHNGIRLQDGSTSNLIFSVPTILSYLSHFMVLEPGDVISTGTPAGVGAGMKPPIFLKPGDRLRLGIEGLGEQSQTFQALAAAEGASV